MDLYITGYGLITPIGCDVKETWENLSKGDTRFVNHKELNAPEGVSLLVGYVENGALERGIQQRTLRKLDRFTLLSMQSFKETIQTSLLEQKDWQDFGIFLGNSTGGWSFVEPQLQDIYGGLFENLSPYVATAWFPTAPQGEISIQYQVSGYSKTFAAGTLSSAYAMEHACELMREGILSGAFVGGSESPLSPLVYNACLRQEPLSLIGEYLPYTSRSSGSILGEGSAFLAIESSQSTQRTNSKVFARILGISYGSSLSLSIERCLLEAEKKPKDVDCIFLDAKGDSKFDHQEYQELAKVFDGCDDIYLTTTKTMHASLLAADFAVQTVIATHALSEQVIPRGLWSKNQHFSPPFGKLVLDVPIAKDLKNILFYSTDLDGYSICMMIEK